MTQAKAIALLIAMALVVVTGCRFFTSATPATPRKSIPSPQPRPDSTPITGVGILGDSSSDEYRADDNRGGTYAATTFNWVELLVQNRGLNFGEWGTWGEPRRTGYKYNWSRSGATAQSLIDSGAHLGLAGQVANGEVSHVFIWIGGNDFATWNGTYANIYNGVISDAELQAKIESVVANITTAVDTVRQAGQVQMVMVTLGDRGITPDAIGQFPDAAKRQRATDAVNAVNDGLKALAVARGIELVDVNTFAVSLRNRLDQSGVMRIGGQTIDIFGYGKEPHMGRLDDDDGHAGTVLSGLIANTLFLEPFNRAYGAGLAPLTDEEILRAAGLADGR
jgi:phospholipase/lecithinase/hemolysin